MNWNNATKTMMIGSNIGFVDAAKHFEMPSVHIATSEKIRHQNKKIIGVKIPMSWVNDGTGKVRRISYDTS